MVCADEFASYDRSVFKLNYLGSEVLCISVPTLLALAADLLTSLVYTVFIGRFR